MKKLFLLTMLLTVSAACMDAFSQTTRAIQRETFYFRYGGGEYWEGNSVAQPVAEKITAIRVGEYFWMQNNFNLWDPFTPTSFYYNYVAFSEQNMVDYFKTIQANNPANWQSLYDVTVDDINEDYGIYFEPWGAYRLHLWGIFSRDKAGSQLQHPNGGGTYQEQYRLPYYEDVRQLFATAPFCDPMSSPDHYVLNERDIRFTFGACEHSNNCAINFYEDNVTRTYWFNDPYSNDNLDIYNLSYMPAGWRSQLWQDWFYNGIWNPEASDGRWWLGMGGLAQMFYALYIPVGAKYAHGLQEDVVTLAEHVNSIPNAGYKDGSPKRTPLRWMRPMTDAELGYKLYIKVAGIENTNEWKALRDNKDEIPLLIAFRNSTINLNSVMVDIREQSHKDPAPSGYVELPKGYLRGFYVQYNILQNSGKSNNQIAKYAANVEDEVLGFRADWQRSSVRVDEVPVSIENNANASVKLYPNPMADVLNISGVSEIKSIRIVDTAGRVCLQFKNVRVNAIDVSSLSKGIYIITLETENGIITEKIIKD